MPILLPIYLLAPATPLPFDAALAAFRARKRFSVLISLDALINKSVTVGRYHLSYVAPNKVLLKKLVNGQSALIFWLNGSKFMAYDPASNEMTQRVAPTGGSIVNQLANALGGALEDPVGVQLSPEMMTAFFSPFRTLSGWTTTRRGDTISVARTGQVDGKKTLTQFDFSASSKLLTKALLLGPGSKLQWVFVYGPPPGSLAFAPPHGTKLVKALSEHTVVNAQDPKARAIVDASLRAYSRIDSIGFHVSGSSGSSDAWMAGSSFRERQAKIEWAYAGGVLTVKDLIGRKAYRGSATPGAVVTYLKRLKSPMEPMLQALLMHKNPIKDWFLTNMKVAGKGSVALNAGRADAVELRSAVLEISLLVRRDNHLVALVSSRAKNPKGRIVSTAQRQFSYSQVNKPIALTTFILPVQNPLPLAQLGK